MSESILIIGASGQIGNELTQALRLQYGNKQVIASDIREGDEEMMRSGPFEIMDATDKEGILSIVKNIKSHKYICWLQCFLLQQKSTLKKLGT